MSHCIGFFKNLPEELLVFDKSVDVILSSVFACGNLKNKCYTEQGLLGVAVCHHLKAKRRKLGNICKIAQSVTIS